jgi:GTP-binding protein
VLADKPRVTVLNKIDALLDEDIAEKRAALEAATGGPVMTMSGVSHEGVTEVLRALRAEIKADRLRQKAVDDDGENASWQP